MYVPPPSTNTLISPQEPSKKRSSPKRIHSKNPNKITYALPRSEIPSDLFSNNSPPSPTSSYKLGHIAFSKLPDSSISSEESNNLIEFNDFIFGTEKEKNHQSGGIYSANGEVHIKGSTLYDKFSSDSGSKIKYKRDRNAIATDKRPANNVKSLDLSSILDPISPIEMKPNVQITPPVSNIGDKDRQDSPSNSQSSNKSSPTGLSGEFTSRRRPSPHSISPGIRSKETTRYRTSASMERTPPLELLKKYFSNEMDPILDKRSSLERTFGFSCDLFAEVNDSSLVENFDPNINHKLKKIKTLDDLKNWLTADNNQVSSKNVTAEIHNFCYSAIRYLFIHKGMHYSEYRDYRSEIASDILYVIQNGGVLVKCFYPKLFKFKRHLNSYIDLTNQTIITSRLKKYLNKLTEIEYFSSEVEGLDSGIKVTTFLKTIDEILPLQKTKKNIMGRIKDSINEAPEAEAEAMQEVKNLIYIAIGGYIEEGENVIRLLREWSSPGNGGATANFQKIQAYCSDVAQLCNEEGKIHTISFKCRIDHQYIDTNMPVLTPEIPKSLQNLATPRAVTNLVGTPHKLQPLEPVKEVLDSRLPYRVDYQGRHISVRSYSYNSITETDRGLIIEGDLLLKSININGPEGHQTTFYDYIVNNHDKADVKNEAVMNQRKYDFYVRLFTSFLENGFYIEKDEFGNIDKEKVDLEAKRQAELMMRFNNNKELLVKKNKSGFIPDTMKLIPCLKITQLMITNCLQVGNQYMGWLLPTFFPERNAIESPFFVQYPPNEVACYVEIMGPDEFQVTQKSKVDIYFYDKSKVINLDTPEGRKGVRVATLDYSWKNKPLIPDVTNTHLFLGGWDGELDITHSEVHKPEFREQIERGLANIRDMRRFPSIPGLHCYRDMKKKRKKKTNPTSLSTS